MIQISLTARGQLRLHFEDGHTVSIPFDPKGFACLRTILIAQARRARPHLISTVASPTQWDIDRWLRAHAPRAELDISLNL